MRKSCPGNRAAFFLGGGAEGAEDAEGGEEWGMGNGEWGMKNFTTEDTEFHGGEDEERGKKGDCLRGAHVWLKPDYIYYTL